MKFKLSVLDSEYFPPKLRPRLQVLLASESRIAPLHPMLIQPDSESEQARHLLLLVGLMSRLLFK